MFREDLIISLSGFTLRSYIGIFFDPRQNRRWSGNSLISTFCQQNFWGAVSHFYLPFLNVFKGVRTAQAIGSSHVP